MARVPENKLRPAWTASVPDHVIGLSWSPDGGRLAVATVSGPVALFDANSGRQLFLLPGHGFGTAAVLWQPGGALVATAGQDGCVRLWNATDGTEAKTIEIGRKAWVERLVWNADGTRLAASAGKVASVWDAAGTRVCELPAQAGTVTDLAWRPGTNHLAVLAYGAAAVYDPAAPGEPVKRFAWKGSPLALAWSPDGRVLAHGNQDATVHFWYYDTGADLQMSGFPTKVRELSWEFSSRYLATGGGAVACIWDCSGPQGPEGTRPQMLEGHAGSLTALAYQSRGYLLASAGSDGAVMLWQPGNKKSPKIGEHHFRASEASAIAWSPDDRSLAVGSGTGAVAVLRAG